jgi:hypothetical protein
MEHPIQPETEIDFVGWLRSHRKTGDRLGVVAIDACIDKCIEQTIELCCSWLEAQITQAHYPEVLAERMRVMARHALLTGGHRG